MNKTDIAKAGIRLTGTVTNESAEPLVRKHIPIPNDQKIACHMRTEFLGGVLEQCI